MVGVLCGMAFATGCVGAWVLTMLAAERECRRLRELLRHAGESLRAEELSVLRCRKRCNELDDRVTQLEGVIRRLSNQSQQISQEARQALGGTLATPCGEREAASELARELDA